MDIGSVLSRAWEIVWKHKVLWIFGILAGCATNNTNTSSYRTSYNEMAPRFQQFNIQLQDWQIALIVGVFILIVLLIIVIAIFLGTIGRVGLIRGTLQAEQGKTSLEFGELFSGSLPYFWRVFGLNLLVGLALAVVGIAVVIFAIVGSVLTLGIAAVCLIPLICLLVPLSWLVNIILEQANIAIVVENLGIMDGLRRGWEVVKENLGMILVMALILYVGFGLIGGLIIGIPIAAIIAPAVIGLINGTQGAVQGGLLIAGLCLVLYIPVAIVLNGVLQSYIKTAWTLTYMRLTTKPNIVEAPATA
jgi:hypothetical protein